MIDIWGVDEWVRRESKQEWIYKILERAMKELLKKSNFGTSEKKKNSIVQVFPCLKHVFLDSFAFHSKEP